MVSSVAGLLSLLRESDSTLRTYALRMLDAAVDEFWAEIASSLNVLVQLNDDAAFPQRKLASLVAAKVCYHLGSLTQALTFALAADELFDPRSQTEFAVTLIGYAIDQYVQVRTHNFNVEFGDAEGAAPREVDRRMEMIVERLFERCFQDGDYRMLLGMALECRRMDVVLRCLREGAAAAASSTSSSVTATKMEVDESGASGSGTSGGGGGERPRARNLLLAHCFDLATSLSLGSRFKQQVLRLLVQEYNSHTNPDYMGMVRCYTVLDDSEALAQLIHRLATSGNGDHLVAYQIAFDLTDSAPQHLINRMTESIRKLQEEAMKPQLEKQKRAAEKRPAIPTEGGDSAPAAGAEAAPAQPPTGSGDPKIDKVLEILTGLPSIELYLDFLYRNSHSDLLIMKKIKEAIPDRQSVLHTAAVMCNGLMHAGTSVDRFWKENIEWLKKATNWAKFTATASLGVIHRGHVKRSREIMADHLPQNGGWGTQPFSQAGALYALGLIHSDHGANMIPFLEDVMDQTQGNLVIQHGGCLGLGLTAMASGNRAVSDRLLNVVSADHDDAVAGEGAATALGMVMLGSVDEETLSTMLRYAQQSRHERVTRGFAFGMSLVLYGAQDRADIWLKVMSEDKDPLLRYGGMFGVGLAYAGTASNDAIRRLLHFAVSDVSDDVRRAAVLSLGFVLCKNPEQCPRVVRLLSESYNPHLRYGSTLAVGISCAGTASKEAIAVLEPLTKDSVDFVRQGAMIAMAMVLIQTNEAQEPKVKTVRELYQKTTTDKLEEVMAKFGAILAAGIIDAGGRNVTIQLANQGHNSMRGIVGMAVFCQYWFWYPFVHFLSLTFKPTALIALNEDLKMPKCDFESLARPSLFAYPPMLTEETKEGPRQVVKAVLSTTAKAKKHKERKDRDRKLQNGTGAAATDMDVDRAQTPGIVETPLTADSPFPPLPENGGPSQPAAAASEPEPNSEVLHNPARVTNVQQKYIQYDPAGRYQPVVREVVMGIAIMRDTHAGEAEDILAPAPFDRRDFFDNEPQPPESFEWP